MRRLLFLLAFLLPAAGFAQAGFEITPQAGYRLSGQLTATDDDGFSEDLDVEVDESNVVGVTADIPLGATNFQLELTANRQESAFVVDRGVLDPSIELGDVEISYFLAGFAYTWGPGQVKPYAALAGGIARFDPDFPALDSDDRLAGSLAFGVKIFFSQNLGLRLEGRGYWADLDTGFAEEEFGDSRLDESLWQAEATAGLIFSF